MKNPYFDPLVLRGSNAVRNRCPMFDDLPIELQQVVNDVYKLTDADGYLIINCMLSAMSIAAQASTDIINPLTHKPIPLSLYCVTVADSGSRKSTVQDIFAAPFREFEKEQEKNNKLLDAQYKHEQTIYNLELKVLTSKLKKAISSDNGDDKNRYSTELRSHTENKPHPPQDVRILTTYTTQSALQDTLSRQWNRLCLHTDEAGKILNSRNFALPSFYNALWNATPQSVERSSNGNQQARDYRFSMHLMLQPSTFSKYVNNSSNDARESGFFARCLFAFPLPNYKRSFIKRVENKKPETPHLDLFIARTKKLLEIAYEKFQCKKLYEQRLLSLQESESMSSLIWSVKNYQYDHKDVAAIDLKFSERVTEHVLRLAGVMHIYSHNSDDDIVKEDLILSAKKIANEFNERYQQAIDYNELSNELISKLLTFIHEQAGHNKLIGAPAISRTFLLQYGPYKLRKKEPLDIALAILEREGEITIKRVGNCSHIIPLSQQSGPYN